MAWSEVYSDKLKCSLCPHNCTIHKDHFGICSIRKNENMKLELPWYGILSAINIDPIEKKPLYHFYPGSKILSIGFYGCNFHCQFCQNYQISQRTTSTTSKESVMPEELVELAGKNGIDSIAYTYSEPVIHFEYIMECAELAHSNDIKNVLVTNGYLNPSPAGELLSLMDGVNVDLKSYTKTFYHKIGGHIEPVKEFIRLASELTHLEVTTLVIPDENDSEEEIINIAGFLANLDINIPLHLSCYYPVFKYKTPPTSSESVLYLVKIAKEQLNFVYPGNIGLDEINSFCNGCGNIIVSRKGYSVSTSGIVNGKCSKCGDIIPFPIQ